jgi:protein TonB
MLGLIGTAAVIAVVGVVLVNMRETISVPLAPPPTQYLAIDEPPVVDPSPVDLKPSDPTTIPYDKVIFDPGPIIWDPAPTTPVGPTVEYGSSPTPGTGIGPSSTPAPPAIPATRPVLIAGEKPEYPGASMRARESGITTLSLCVSRQGRVTSASVSASSGFARLDQAALAWIKHERFKPGTENGQPADVCNHTLSYEWKLPAR